MKFAALSALMAVASGLEEGDEGYLNIERFFKFLTFDQLKESFDDGSISRCPLEGFCLPRDGTSTTCGTVTLVNKGNIAVSKTEFSNVCIWVDACDASVDIEDGEF